MNDTTQKIVSEARHAIEIMPRSRSDYSERVERIIQSAIDRATKVMQQHIDALDVAVQSRAAPSSAKATEGKHASEQGAVREALQVVLDCVDYTANNCTINNCVGAVLPRQVIEKARAALSQRPTPAAHAVERTEEEARLAARGRVYFPPAHASETT